jgi:aspartate carbamoyltransferase regulatory subunit
MYPNQYPNQPYNTQPQTLPKKSSATKIIFILMITTGFCLFISVGVWIFCASKSSSDNGKTPNEMAALLDTKDSAPLNQEVKSSLGVSVKYNSRELMAFGFADGSTFSGDDLDEKRDYGVIRIRPVETNQAARDEITLVSPELRITSTSDKKYWEKLLGKEGYKNLPKIDALIKSNNEQRSSDNRSIEISSSKDINFKDFKYKNFICFYISSINSCRLSTYRPIFRISETHLLVLTTKFLIL